MKYILIAALALASCRSTDYTQYVNPFIGTDGTGHSFPGASMPFGMVQPSPDNRNRGWDYTSGYQYRDSIILGFSQTHMNGTGINDLGDVLLQPVVGNERSSFGQRYSKQTEKASPGYYTVTLANGTKVELTATNRVALHRYTYPQSSVKMLVDLQHGLCFLTDSLVLESDVRVDGPSSLSGYLHTKNWVERKYFFTLEFSQPFTSYEQLPLMPKENAPRYLFSFSLPQKQLLVKVSLSTVSVDGAKNNLNTELPAWNFDAVAANAKAVWNGYLKRVEVEADRPQMEIFYSSMYRLMLQPSNIADADGRYRGADDSIRVAPNNEYYSTLSLWDTYRAAHPLYTLIVPERVDGFVRTMIAHSQAAGFLPIWTVWGHDNYCMIGNHAIPVITDAYMKGFRGFDAKEALRQMVKSTTENHFNSSWTLLNRYGYYPYDSLDNEAVSRTLEHGVDDYSIALMARWMGENQIADTYEKRSTYFRNLYDTSTKQMRGKNSRGEWRTPFDPLDATSPMNNPGDYTEANAWQYFWTPAQYNVEGLAELLGGKRQLTEHLDKFFEIEVLNPDKHLGQEALIGQYAHGNEPSHHVAYLYQYSDKPYKTAELVKRICNDFYRNTPNGIIGNDDCGQMSAWYIFSALGFYPVNPSNATFVLGDMQVKGAKVHLANGKTLHVSKTSRPGVYWNGKALTSPILKYDDISKGGKLEFGPLR